MKMLAVWLINALIIFVSPKILSGIKITDFATALITALVIGLLNAVLKPILIFLTLPLTILTLGLFTFVISAVMILLASHFVPGFTVISFWYALLLSLTLSIVNGIIK
ncbi:MAG: phage holin family protein [Patescibacteria group bacterium]|nr:phage holin family protein [Patescibacteria group bacterium]MDD4304175.1 phage holin family protein [Patescibacteria group bacterium]MDD4695207.1 phage holin family protein [Patescibacteria group bacterium]